MDLMNQSANYEHFDDFDCGEAAQRDVVDRSTSTNSGYTKCKCKVPRLPTGFTSMRKSDICCQSCGMHFA